LRIAVDAFGGDNAPEEIVKGCVLAAEQISDEIILVGDETKLSALLEQENFPEGRISIRHASEVIETAEPPVESIRKKKDSSLVVALSLVKNGEVDAVVSAGNTGAYLAGAFRILGRMKGIKRPALTTPMPTVKEAGVILDAGANADCRPEHLVQFAHMGAIYAEHVLGIPNPRVALLNIGAEEAKGNSLTKETHLLLKEEEGLNFIGNIEPRDVPYGAADVIVCDGFTGNVVIKLIEGTASALFSMLKGVFYKSFITKLAAMILKPGLKKVKAKMDYSEYGGVPLLGVDGVVFKAHGSSDRKAICNAVRAAGIYLSAGVNDKIKEVLLNRNEEEKEAE